MLTTQFFAMKIQRYMGEHGISASTLAKVAAKAFRNGSANPNAWRRTPLSEEQILSSRMVNHPLTQYMFCSPGEGARCAGARPRRTAARAERPPVYLRSVAFRTRRFGSFEVFSPVDPDRVGPVADRGGGRGRIRAGGHRPGGRGRRAVAGHRVRS